MLETMIRQQARSMHRQAEVLKMMRLAQEGKLAEHLISKEIRKVQNKMNRKMRNMMGLK